MICLAIAYSSLLIEVVFLVVLTPQMLNLYT
jgi:hypothetical protein